MNKDYSDFESGLIYKNVLQNMQDGVITIASDGTIITFNPAAAHIFMFKECNFAGMHFVEIFSKLLIDPRNDELNDAILSSIYESTVTHNKDVKYYMGDICKQLLVSSTALFVEKDETKTKIGMILVISDITERQRLAYVQNLFGKYIDPQIAKRLLANPEENLMKATRQEMTVSFCDMNDFTKMCESLPPTIMTKLMNSFFAKMAQTVHKNHGVIDKFIGDSIMSFWGFPFTESRDHTFYGCETALEQIACMDALSKEVQSIDVQMAGISIRVCIGIATGELLMANIGSQEHQSFTVMGNVVNLASRLVGANKIYGTTILLSDDVVKSTGANFEYREVDTIKVKGKDKQTTVYELLGFKGTLTEHQLRFLETYAAALNHYRQQNWSEASKAFTQALELMPQDKASSVFLQRIQYFIKNPPFEGWCGVWVLESK